MTINTLPTIPSSRLQTAVDKIQTELTQWNQRLSYIREHDLHRTDPRLHDEFAEWLNEAECLLRDAHMDLDEISLLEEAPSKRYFSAMKEKLRRISQISHFLHSSYFPIR